MLIIITVLALKIDSDAIQKVLHCPLKVIAHSLNAIRIDQIHYAHEKLAVADVVSDSEADQGMSVLEVNNALIFRKHLIQLPDNIACTDVLLRIFSFDFLK